MNRQLLKITIPFEALRLRDGFRRPFNGGEIISCEMEQLGRGAKYIQFEIDNETWSVTPSVLAFNTELPN